MLVCAMILLGVSLARGPDQDLHMKRTIPSDLDPSRLDRNLSAVSRWPQWFFSLGTAKPITNEQTIAKGSRVILHMDPKKGPWKKFDLTVEVKDYVPEKALVLQVLEDSSGRLFKLFDSIEWNIEFLPSQKGSLIQGSVSAHTKHWKSRFFGRIAEKILMNQIFYPDLLKLAELKQPFSLDPPNQPSSGI